LTNKQARFLYEVGDLVELARFGFSPQNECDRVFALVIGVIDPIDYFVPRYRVRLNYRPLIDAAHLDDFVVSRDQMVITVMEYDIVEKGAGDKEGSQG
jgi:hypothetical protein